MSQYELKLLGRVDGPSMVPSSVIVRIKTYSEAVTACWVHRRIKGMTKTSLADLTGMRASHLTDYFSVDRYDNLGRERREMPAKHIPAMEAICGNTFITQWLLEQANLRAIEVVLAEAA